MRSLQFKRTFASAAGQVEADSQCLEEAPEIGQRRQHTVAVVVDRISVDPAQRGRLTDSVEAALNVGRGAIQVVLADQAKPEQNWKSLRFSLNLSCSS
ncbi:MAG: hypothetical protein ACK5YO_03655 [Planctomyces sp.]